MKQEILEFKRGDQIYNSDNFIISDSNILAYKYIDKWPDWSSNILIIYGGKSCGKTHLVNIWAQRSDAQFISFEQLADNKTDLSNNLIIEDINLLKDENSLFHFYNNFKENSDKFLILTCDKEPSKLDINLPDLKSRLSHVNSVKIEELSDEILHQIIFRLFSNKQIKIDKDVVNFISLRVERSYNKINELVEIIDKESFKNKRNITIPFVKQYL